MFNLKFDGASLEEILATGGIPIGIFPVTWFCRQCDREILLAEISGDPRLVFPLLDLQIRKHIGIHAQLN